MREYKYLKVTKQGQVTIVHLPNETGDRLETVQMNDELLSLSEGPAPVQLVVTFDEARWFGSEAIGALIRLVTRIRANDGDVRLSSMSKKRPQDLRDLQLDWDRVQSLRHNGRSGRILCAG